MNIALARQLCQENMINYDALSNSILLALGEGLKPNSVFTDPFSSRRNTSIMDLISSVNILAGFLQDKPNQCYTLPHAYSAAISGLR